MEKFRVKAYDENALRNANIFITEGRLPKNSSEVIASVPEGQKNVINDKIKVGEKVELTTNGETKEYKIVGITNKLDFDNTNFYYCELGMITFLEKNELENNTIVDITILTNNIHRITQTTKNIANRRK